MREGRERREGERGKGGDGNETVSNKPLFTWCSLAPTYKCSHK